MKMIPCISVHRNLAFLHHVLGGFRWKSSCRPAPLLTAAPVRPLIDEEITIKGRFLPPHCPVTFFAQTRNDDGVQWDSFAHYYTNAEGTVNFPYRGPPSPSQTPTGTAPSTRPDRIWGTDSVTRDHSIGGSYLGCEPMGLIWGLQPVTGATELLSMRKNVVETPSVVLVSLLEGHVSPREGQSTELATLSIERWYMAPGVRRIKIRQNGIMATLFLPPGPGPHPAMLDLWGLGRGLVETRSALLASRGYASLSLCYLGRNEFSGLENRVCVDDSYFKDHHQVCADRVGIIGLSFGAYLTLRIATQTGVKPSCVICINGPVGCPMKLTDTHGRTEIFESDRRFWSYDDEGFVSFREAMLPANLNPEGKVKIEHLACPLMSIVGEDDLTIPSKESSNLIEETLKAAGKSHLLTCLSYPGAGHLIEPPYTPNVRASLWSHDPNKLISLWGGHLAPHAFAQEDAWKKILHFMETNLRH